VPQKRVAPLREGTSADRDAKNSYSRVRAGKKGNNHWHRMREVHAQQGKDEGREKQLRRTGILTRRSSPAEEVFSVIVERARVKNRLRRRGRTTGKAGED